MIEAAALERPVMIELEDWHWADAASARLLDVVTRRPSAAPVTLVVTERPVEGVPLEPRETDTVIDLTELDDVVARDVADSVLARLGQQADAGRIDRIVELGAGNPLMIETLIDVGGEIGRHDRTCAVAASSTRRSGGRGSASRCSGPALSADRS